MLKSVKFPVNKNDKTIAVNHNHLSLDKSLVSSLIDLGKAPNLKNKLSILNKDKKGELDQETLSILAATVLAVDAGFDTQVAQLGLEGLAGAVGSSGAAGAGAGAAGAAGAAAGAAGAAGAAAATVSAAVAASAATATTVASTAVVASTTSTLGVVAGVAAAAAAGGGGGGGGGGSSSPPSITPPVVPTPPALPSGPVNVSGAGPFTGGPGGNNTLVFDPNSSDPAWNLSAVPVALYNVSGNPGNPLNKSLVLDLTSPVNSDGYRVFYYTQNPDNNDAHAYTTIGYYKNFQNITGTIKNDMLSGDAGANIISGGDGNDIIYGGGGADTLVGGAGNDWVVFKPVTRANTSDTIYSTNLNVNLENGTYSYGVLTVNGTLSGFENVLGSDGNDIIRGDANNNILVGGNGEDVIYGGGGDDIIYGGSSAITGLSGPWHGNQVWGGAGSDTFMVGYNYDPVKASQNNADGWQTAVAGTDVIRDWDAQGGGIGNGAGRDSLVVSNLGVAVIGGLAPNDGSAWVDWSGNDTVDLRAGNNNYVTNNGTIIVAAGAGTNTIYASAGKDIFYVGYEFLSTSGVIDGQSTPSQLINPSLTLGAVAHDSIWGWDDQTANRDTLYVSQGDTAIIASLAVNDLNGNNWNGNDKVDLRNQVVNAGTVIVTTGLGSNLVYGSLGNEIIYGGAAGPNNLNQVWGGGGSDIFNVGYNYGLVNGVFSNPLLFNSSITTTSRDIIWDWGNLAGGNGMLAQDTLNVSLGSVAIIGGLAGKADWSGNDFVDLSSNVNNSGTIIVAGGAGYDHIVGSSGNDIIYGGSDAGYDVRTLGLADGIVGNDMPGNQVWGNGGANIFYVGYNYDPLTNQTTPLTGSTSGTDVIWDWNASTQDVVKDTLYVGPNGTAIIGGLATTGSNWGGNDLVDLRYQVDNLGKIVVSTGAGNDTIYGSNGTDWIFGGTGLNYVDLGGGLNGTIMQGSDRVYIDSFQSKYNIVGFTSQDTIYIDQRIVDAFGVAKSWGPVQFDTNGNPTEYGWIDRSALDPNTYYRNDLATGSVASVDAGQNYTYGPVSGLEFNAVYNATLGSIGSSNGAYSNWDHYGAVVAAKAAVSATAGALLGVAAGLSAIPFVGPILAIPFVVISGILTYETIATDFRHMNPFYNVGDANSQLALPYLTMMKNLVDPTVGGNGNWDNPSFLSFYNPPQDGYLPTLEVQTGIIRGLYNSSWAGIHSIIALETGLNTATTADDKTFIYLVNSPDGMIQNNETILLAEVNGHLTPNQIKFYNGADQTDPSNLYLNNSSTVQPILPPQINLGLVVTDDAHVLSNIVRTNSVNSKFQIALASAPLEDVTINLYRDDIGGSVLVYTGVIGANASSVTDPTAGWTYDATIGWYHDVTLNTSTSGNYHVDVVGSQGFVNSSAFQLVIDTQAPVVQSVATTDSSVIFSTNEDGHLYFIGHNDIGADLVGQSAVITMSAQQSVITLNGVHVNDSLGNASDVIGGVIPEIILGTDANDNIDLSSSATNAVIYGFGGNDHIIGTNFGDQIYGGAGDDIITGGSGNDTIDGGTGNNIIDGGSGVNTVSYSSATTGVVVDLGVGTATHGVYTDTLTHIQNIVGSSYDDTLIGNALDNVISGGAGNDTLTGGGGHDTFVFTNLGGHSLITDYSTVTDAIQLSKSAFTGLSALGALGSTEFESGANLTAASSLTTRIIYDTVHGNLYYDADGSGSGASILIATFTNTNPVLDVHQFTVIA